MPLQPIHEERDPLNNIIDILLHVNLLRKLFVVVDEYYETVRNAKEFIKETTRYYDVEIFCVNVKRHNVKRHLDYVDLEDLLDKINVTREEKEYIENALDMDDLYVNWLEHERGYIVDDFMGGCLHTSRKWYEENVKSKILKGEKTGYMSLDKIRSKKKKLLELEKWIVKEEVELSYLDLFDKESAEFYGSSGDWFGVQLISTLDSDLELMSDLFGDFSNTKIFYFEERAKQDIEYIKGMIEDINYKIEAIEWLLDSVSKMNEGLDFEEEVKYRIEELREGYKNDLVAD